MTPPTSHPRAAALRLLVPLLAALAALLAATPAATARTGTTTVQKVLERADAEQRSRAATVRGLPALPLPRPNVRETSTARAAAATAREAHDGRLLVGARAHADIPGLSARLRELGAASVQPISPIGVLAVSGADPDRIVGALADDPRVAYVEPDRPRRLLLDLDRLLDPGTGVAFGWAFDAVNARPALAAAGGGSDHLVAVLDSGLDLGHPDTGPVQNPLNVVNGSDDVTDRVGHGTFVTGLINAEPRGSFGMRGIGGHTPVRPILVGDEDGISSRALTRAIERSVSSGARIINLSLGGESIMESEARALDLAFMHDVLPVAAAGNSAEEGNPLEFPAALIGGIRGDIGTGLSVGAIDPDGDVASFSNRNDFLSVVAPGAGRDECHGVLSTVPRAPTFIFDHLRGCFPVFGDPLTGARWSYGEGTSFAAPIVSAVAALTWKAEPRLRSEQVAHVIQRTAADPSTAPSAGDGTTYAGGRGNRTPWNSASGRGLVDADAALKLAGTYDLAAPLLGGRASRRGARGLRLLVRARDRTSRGRELAGGVRILAATSRRRADLFRRARPVGGTSFRRTIRLGRGRTHVLVAACDRNLNCRTRTGSFRARRR